MTTFAFPLRIFIGIYQIAICFFLFYLIIVKYFQSGLLSTIILAIPVSFLIFFSTYASISLIKNKKKGINLSLINLALYLLQFSFSGIYYYIIIGPFVFLGYKKVAENGISFWTDYGYFTGTIYLSLTKENNNIHFVTINLFVLILILALFYIKSDNRIKNKITI